MSKRQALVFSAFLVLLSAWSIVPAFARAINVNARSAMLVDLSTGHALYEQNADVPIAPASITKVLTLYMVFEAMREGRLHLWDNVTVSSRAAKTGGSRMGLRTGDIVPVGELVKGMAVVSGNDACVAIAEHMSGSVEDFVQQMNVKARQLGMQDSNFNTPNGLPAKGQLTTARDIAKLSMAYLRRYPESLNIHSMQSYTYRTTTHRNANRLLSTCQGVDGLKTGFVCAAGYNLTATAVRGDRRLVAVVLGAPSPGVRAAETARLLEEGYDALNTGTVLVRAVDDSQLACPVPQKGSSKMANRSWRQRGKSRQAVVTDAPKTSGSRGKLSRSSSRKDRTQTVGSDSVRITPSQTKSPASRASRSGQSTESAQATNQRTRKSSGGTATMNSKNPTVNKTQIVIKDPGTTKGAADIKPSRAGSKQTAPTEKAADTRKRATSGNPDKTTPIEKQKASSPPPAIRKLNPIQKSSTHSVELRTARS